MSRQPSRRATALGVGVLVVLIASAAVTFALTQDGGGPTEAGTAAGGPPSGNQHRSSPAPEPPPIRGVHVTGHAWASDELRRPIVRFLRRGWVSVVQLDLKDESGLVAYDSRLPRVQRVGANAKLYNLERAVTRIHRLGGRVIGRVVAFRDPVLAKAAWRAGKRAQVIQTPGGRRFAGYGGFTNFANAQVRRYNIRIAAEAAAAGVDEILYDYVRRPEGPLTEMKIPGLESNPAKAITEFLEETRARLLPTGTLLGASVFGVAAERPWTVAQNIPRMARHVDYIAPMVYPSHWSPGEYGVANPNAQPYKIVLRSLRDFKKKIKGTEARVVPWLQDFSLGVDYGADEVRAQIKGAARIGIDEWLLWDPEVTYSAAALRRQQ